MSLHDRIKEARKSKGLTQEQLASLIGVAKTTVTGYEKNREPTAAKVGEIADALDVDANFLYQDEIKELYKYKSTPEEFENIIKKYRLLDDIGRKRIDFDLEMEVKRSSTASDQADQIEKLTLRGDIQFVARTFAYYGKIASAGKSFGFEDMTAGTIECAETVQNKHADYAIGVSGDSMEPTYHDGDIVYVKKTSELDVGDIGIFQKDNGIYIKEVGHDGLLSHNPKYLPMVSDSQVICLGKVIGKVDNDDPVISD